MNDRNGRFDTTCTGKSNNVRHVNTVSSAQFVIENVKPCTRISVRALCDFFSLFLANPAKERRLKQQ